MTRSIRLYWLGVLLAGYITGPAQGTLKVCEQCDWSSIGAALAAASDGDTVRIAKGWYREGNLVIDKALVIKGEDFPILDGDNKTEVLTVTANQVTIEGLQIQNVGTSYLEDRAGIRVKNSKGFCIRNNRLLNTFFGIYLEKSADGVLEGNQIIGQAEAEMSSGNAIHLWYCKRITIKQNRVSGHRDGIYFEFVDDSEIHDNISDENLRYGLHFMFSNNDRYYHNVFRRNGAGVAVMFSKKITMQYNAFEYNWGKAAYGLLLKEIYDADIRYNLFKHNTIGVYVEGSTRINYLYNEFISNGWALKISGGCLDNIVSENNFLSNTFDLSIVNIANSNNFDGNYWSDYSGYDLDRNGVGDVPHRPVKLFNYIVNRTPEATVLLRSLFIDIVNFSEKVSPVFTPKDVMDNRPYMNRIAKAKQ